MVSIFKVIERSSLPCLYSLSGPCDHGLYFGSFITSSIVNHKKIVEKANQHEKNKWHIESFIRSKDFKDMKKTNCGIDTRYYIIVIKIKFKKIEIN